LESAIESAADDLLKRLGYLTIKMRAPPKGIPDRLCLGPGGHVFFIEYKDGDNTPSFHQRVLHKAIRALGFTIVVAYSKQDVLDYLGTLDRA